MKMVFVFTTNNFSNKMFRQKYFYNILQKLSYESNINLKSSNKSS